MRARALLVASLVLAAPLAGAAAHAEPAPAATPALATLLVELGRHGQHLEEMKARGSYVLRGHIDELDGDGAAKATRDLVLQVTATGRVPSSTVVEYREDGVDKTAEAQKKAAERAKKKVDSRRDFHLPFLPSEQLRYDFTWLGSDAQHPDRVKIGFRAKVPAEDAWNGFAWVDPRLGEVEEMTFGFSKLPTFVDAAEATMRFGTQTELGRAPSRIDVEARGGFLFLRRHLRARATLEAARLEPKPSP